jgi:hypothetical protein
VKQQEEVIINSGTMLNKDMGGKGKVEQPRGYNEVKV